MEIDSRRAAQVCREQEGQDDEAQKAKRQLGGIVPGQGRQWKKKQNI